MAKFYKLAFLCFMLISCSKESSNMNTSTVVFDSGKKQISFNVEIAKTPEQMRTGLMNRDKLGDKQGMYFMIKPERSIVMWMKDTKLSLDMIFVDAQSQVSGIINNAVPMSEALLPSPGQVSAVIELNAGTAKKYNIKIGDRVLLDSTK